MLENRFPRKGDVLLLVGTRKGAYILPSDSGKLDWAITAAAPIFELRQK